MRISKYFFFQKSDFLEKGIVKEQFLL